MNKVLSATTHLAALLVILFGLISLAGSPFLGWGSTVNDTKSVYWAIAVIPFSVITLMGITQRRSWAVVVGVIQSLILAMSAFYALLASNGSSDKGIFWNHVIVLICSLVATAGAHRLASAAKQKRQEVSEPPAPSQGG